MKSFYMLRMALQKLGYKVEVTLLNKKLENIAVIISCDIHNANILKKLNEYPKEKCYLFLWEPPVVKPFLYNKNLHQYFSKIFTMVDSLVDNERYFKFYYPQPSLNIIENIVPFEQKKLCTLIGCNKASTINGELYSERLAVIQFFENLKTNDFEFYGVGWPSFLHNYKGATGTKKECLKNYRFCFCYENTKNLSGYITEKIFDCFVAGCVPIYWGACNIADYIPNNCFIDRRNFQNNKELYIYLKSMTPAVYQKYIDAIKKFLKSKQAFLFSTSYFVDSILSLINPNYDLSIIFIKEEQIKLKETKKMRDKIL
ncbi:MAG: glycosyltransferase family 10 [Candidatus Babeliales bacterium]